MAYYLVRARLQSHRAAELRQRLEARAFDTIRPFGPSMARALERAHRDPDSQDIVWEEQCYCNPPLAAERVAVLDRYFDDIRTEEVPAGEGWKRIQNLPALWEPGI